GLKRFVVGLLDCSTPEYRHSGMFFASISHYDQSKLPECGFSRFSCGGALLQSRFFACSLIRKIVASCNQSPGETDCDSSAQGARQTLNKPSDEWSRRSY